MGTGKIDYQQIGITLFNCYINDVKIKNPLTDT